MMHHNRLMTLAIKFVSASSRCNGRERRPGFQTNRLAACAPQNVSAAPRSGTNFDPV